MAKKAAARKSKAKKSPKSTTRRAAGTRAATRAPLVRVEFKRLHAEMDAALAKLQARKPSLKRDALILKIKFMRGLKLCPKVGMAVELS
jgi:hypothetical protein